MHKFLIEGGRSLQGDIPVSGAKNAVLPIFTAALLAEDESVLEGVPELRDVFNLAQILESLGLKVNFTGQNNVVIDPSKLNAFEAPYELVRKLRASYYILGALLGKVGQARCALPGGDKIGNRGIDLHIKGFRALGAEVKLEHGIVEVKANRLKGTKIYLDYPSVGATVNIMLAATLAEGETVIENVAKEPEIIDLANYLNVMGANIKGAGTDVIKIKGVTELHGTTHQIIPDRIEAGTYMIAAAITRGDLFVRNMISEHLKSLIAKLKEMGCSVEEEIEGVRVKGAKFFKPVDIKTLPYPGFPTDLQPQMTSLLTQAEGISLVIETVYDDRFHHIQELNRMGAEIKIDGRSALIKPARLSSAKVKATDIRAGAALILAGLVADGETEVSDIYHIQRGYENIEDKLKGVGARIKID
ncbi:MAG: UDP-N-acetylglucosamine 1-carboxyvinyltransferase [Halanaerobium sp.]|nr:UDP-N-acetylglucosamine 1-carboxyvinyltransferase [Halanaerobium sp.]